MIVTYHNEAELRALQELAGPNQSSLEGHQVDVTDPGAVAGLINTVVAKYGAVDALVNTVGGYAGGIRMWDLETSVFNRMLELNLGQVSCWPVRCYRSC